MEADRRAHRRPRPGDRTGKATAKKASSATKKATGTAKTAAAAASRSSTSPTASRRSSRSGGQDAVALSSPITAIEQLVKEFEGLGPTAHRSREATVAKVSESLARHAAIEEEILYPAMRDRAKDRKDLVLEALEEHHHIVKWTLSELEKMRSTDERYTAHVPVLMESVRHDVEEEEGELFPQVREMSTKTELDDMGERLKLSKKAAPTRPHPRSPDEPPGNIVANTLVAPLDATAAVAGGVAKAVRRAVR